jgi:hypothetical protein
LNWYAGRRAEADRYGKDAISILESLPPGAELARVENLADQRILCDALSVLGTSRLWGGDASGWGDLDKRLQIGLARNFQVEVIRNLQNHFATAIYRREYQRAAEYLRRGLAFCEERDLDTWKLYLIASSARMKFEQGLWSEASVDAEEVLRNPRATPGTRIPTLRILGHLRIRRGDPDAQGPLDEARILAGAMPEVQRIGALAAVRTEAAWLAEDWDRVRSEVQPAYDQVVQRRDPRLKGELAVWLWRVNALAEQPTDIAEPYAMEISGDRSGAARAWNAV